MYVLAVFVIGRENRWTTAQGYADLWTSGNTDKLCIDSSLSLSMELFVPQGSDSKRDVLETLSCLSCSLSGKKSEATIALQCGNVQCIMWLTVRAIAFCYSGIVMLKLNGHV